MNHYIINLVDALRLVKSESEQRQRVTMLAAELVWAEDDEIDYLLGQLIELSQAPCWAAAQACLEPVCVRLHQRTKDIAASVMADSRVELVAAIYSAIPAANRARSYLLGWLASQSNHLPLATFTHLIVDNPPQCETGLVVAFGPLLSNKKLPVPAIFPKLLEALAHREIAPAVLDVANYLTREGHVREHPATDRLQQLMDALDQISFELGRLEQGIMPANRDPAKISAMVNDSVALVTAISHALSLIGDTRGLSPLRRAAELKHRRILTEALAAMAKLGDEAAGRRLIKLANEPVARLRVLAYAEELDLLDQIANEYKSEEAQAESRLAMWLAQPAQMGLPPNRIKLLDRRSLFWPSYEEPVDCFVMQYEYSFSQPFSNIGIVGPVTQAFVIGLTHLDLADLYACFAGWHCDHDEIRELTIEQAQLEQPGLVERLLARVEEPLPENLEPCFLGWFLGQGVLVAAGIRNGKAGTLIVDEQQSNWFEWPGDDVAASRELAYCIYKGRRLLGAFNSPEQWPGRQLSRT